MIRRGFTKTELVVVLVILCGLMFCCAPFGFWPAELVVYLSIGWIPFLGRVGPQIEPDWGTITLGLAALAIFTLGLHGFLRWFHAARHSVASANDAVTARSAWRMRWTVSAVAIVVMLFVAGISMVGITHQLAWMATVKGPLLTSGFSRRLGSANNLGQTARALHERSEQKEELLPPGTYADERGAALHGWQSAILPYVSPAVSEQIDRTRPWNHERNREPCSTQIKQFQLPETNAPTTDAAGYALSHYAANQHVIGGTRKMKLDEITDGTANTILAGEAAGNYKPWGHPRNWRDPALGINASPDGFGSPWSGGANIVMADGSVKFLSDKTAPEVLRALATPAGGEKLPAEY